MGKRKQEHEKEANLERWLVSYADFITLLFAVFVTLYAMGQVDKKRAEDVSHSLKVAFGLTRFSKGTGAGVIENTMPMRQVVVMNAASGPNTESGQTQKTDLLSLKQRLEEALYALKDKGTVGVDIDSRGLVITLSAMNFFDPGSAQIRPAAYGVLDEVARQVEPFVNPVRVEGHTDDIPVEAGTFPSNWELSAMRAVSVLRFLVERHQFDVHRLSATGFGSARPVADNATEQGRNLNRRVEILVLTSRPGG